MAKSKAQMMRVAAVLHALFSLDPEHDLTTQLSASSVRAALDLVEVCNKHTKIIAGRTDTSSSPTTRKKTRHLFHFYGYHYNDVGLSLPQFRTPIFQEKVSLTLVDIA